MAILGPQLFGGRAIGDAVESKLAGDSETAFGRLISAIKDGVTASRRPKPRDPALNFVDVKNTLPALAALEAIAGRPGAATGPFLAGAQERKSSAVANENEIARQHAEEAVRMAQANTQIAELGFNRSESKRQEALGEKRFAQGARERELARADANLRDAEGRQDRRIQGLVDNWEKALEKANPIAIKQAALALKNIPADLLQKYSLYVPSDDDVSRAVDEAHQKNREWAVQTWDKTISKYTDQYGFVSDADRAKLVARGFVLAKLGHLAPEDGRDIFVIPTAKTLGMKSLEERVRSAQAREGETKRHDLALEADSKKRLENEASRIAIARGHLQVAQQNANTNRYRATHEANQAHGDMEALYKQAEGKLRALGADKKALQGQLSGAKNDKARAALQQKLQGVNAEWFYWKQLQFEAAGASKESQDMLRFIEGLPGFIPKEGLVPQINLTLPPGSGGQLLPPGPIPNGGPPGTTGSATVGQPGSKFTLVRPPGK